MQPRRRGQSQLGLGVIMLASQLLNVGLDRIPPVTLATIAAQVALFLNLVKPPWHRYDACISVFTVLRQGDYKRVLISTFEHADEWHLYYNMVSFLWKGMRLEQRMGSRKFAILLGVFSVSCSLTYLALAKTATEFLQDESYSRQCAIGFSGVIFALKVLTQRLESASDSWTYLRGLAVPARWAVWAELVLIHILVPGASFVGHLAGILVGLAYTYGPLEYLVDTLDKAIGVPMARASTSRPAGASYTYHSSRSGRRAEPDEREASALEAVVPVQDDFSDSAYALKMTDSDCVCPYMVRIMAATAHASTVLKNIGSCAQHQLCT
ncbi:rhomboid-related protein 4-like [Pollicipes pollicipes]|uniref:rhomboid-related protein 4-like n=1 Tax=Pollicipes pollicipes TaxID=41117 RepID=UPI001884A419|nr:rhomboid-related protein 4-like [Pollicipes pollicipes]